MRLDCRSHLNPIHSKGITLFRRNNNRKDSHHLQEMHRQNEYVAEEILQDLKENTALIKQISHVDAEIQKIQLSIAQLGNKYAFVDAMESNSGLYQNSPGEQTTNSNFLAQRDIRAKLLPLLKNVMTQSQQITAFDLLGNKQTQTESRLVQLDHSFQFQTMMNT